MPIFSDQCRFAACLFSLREKVAEVRMRGAAYSCGPMPFELDLFLTMQKQLHRDKQSHQYD
jgi:hypothetical protein